LFVKIVAETGKKSSGKGSKVKKSKGVPSDGELQAKIRELLREADFSKVSDGRIRNILIIIHLSPFNICSGQTNGVNCVFVVPLMGNNISLGCTFCSHPMDAVIHSYTITRL